jgi:hypothetical protein
MYQGGYRIPAPAWAHDTVGSIRHVGVPNSVGATTKKLNNGGVFLSFMKQLTSIKVVALHKKRATSNHRHLIQGQYTFPLIGAYNQPSRVVEVRSR